MIFLAKLLELMTLEMETPTSYGWFHLMFVGLTLLACVFLCVRFRNSSERTERRVVFVLWLIMLVLEIYKQIIFTFEVVDGSIVGDYAWYAFPFQLCSTPLYVLPFVAFLPNGRLRDAVTGYTIAFSIFGGLCVYAFPGDVFMSYIGINIQTMIHHGIQIIVGVYLASKYRHRLTLKYYLEGGLVFIALVIVALVMNVGVHNALRALGHDDTFNMFYISPYHDCTLPLLSSIYPLVPYPVFLAIYVVGFILAAAIIFFAAKGITHLAHSVRMRLKKNEA